MNVIGIPSETIFDVFPLVKPYFDSFAERSRGETTANELALDVATKKQQCWVVRGSEINAIALTCVKGKVIEITHCSGSGREDWQDALVDEIEKWAAHMNANRVRAICRPGWSPFLKKRGYAETHRILERDIG